MKTNLISISKYPIVLKTSGLIEKKTKSINENVNNMSKIFTYNERLSEQKLLYYLFDLFNTHHDVHFVLQKVVDALPTGSAFPDEISARIKFNESEYCSPNFKKSSYSLNNTFKTFSEKRGEVEIYYKNNPVLRHMGPSFIESHMLIEGISKMLESWLNRFETEKELEKMLVQLEMKIENRTDQLRKANQRLTEMNKDINDSINYANRIQRAILPTNDIINEVFTEAFVFYKPKDIISGDFYWLHKTTDKIFYACADCTGHGVPGALMSMVGHQLLDHIITDRKISDPELILEEMDSSIIRLFKKSLLSEHLRDGMSMSLCVIDTKNSTVSFSGAFNNAYMFKKDKMIVLEADRKSIGESEVIGGKKFTKTTYSYNSGDLLYMFTDGLPDQFGGNRGKKLMRKNLLELINQNKHENMELQGQIYEYYFDKWKGQTFQVDDVTLLGLRL